MVEYKIEIVFRYDLNEEWLMGILKEFKEKYTPQEISYSKIISVGDLYDESRKRN